MDSNVEAVKAALISFGLKDGATLTEVRAVYLDKTSQPKFHGIFVDDELLVREFQKYYRSYATLLKYYQESGFADETEEDMSYYPPDQMQQLYLNQGIYLVCQQNYIKASDKIQQAYNVDSKNIQVLLYMGYLLMIRKNYYAAEKYFREVVQINKDIEDAWFYLGESYNKAGDKKKALSMYETAKVLNPGHSEIAARIKEIKISLGMAPTTRGKAASKKSFLSALIDKLTGKS